ncbi:MAG TPA: radical SAM protein [Alphaproteobacteria bacterium]|nr:radical SAM protein [Alphaproteobacteria bacterium]HAJ48006.1 radical SAM protein [Alphaproteobacteria bacterium]
MNEMSQRKFTDPDWTAKGEPRASVAFRGLETLWINTGTLCNITCQNCYIESSPDNDRLVYLTTDEIRHSLDEARTRGEPLTQVGFTGGEPFLNPHMPAMLALVLERGLSALILTNAMKPMMRPHVQAALLALKPHRDRLIFRVSIDHWREDLHDEERGPGAFRIALDGMRWLHAQGFTLAIAGRLRWGDSEADMRGGFRTLLNEQGLHLDASNPEALVLFPEMDAAAPVPEITTACWGILKKSPDCMMCANTRMLVKRKGSISPTYVSCTLLPYDAQFDLGETLEGAARPVKLNHPHCAKFCVLGGASCG